MAGHTYRVGIVGAGGIARAHGAACRAVDCAQLVAVCDVSAEAAGRFGDEFDVPKRYTSLPEMLASEELDIAVICTWGASHAEVGIAIAESRRVRAILCEKPFTLTGDEGARFVAAAKANDTLVAEAYKFRHHPMHLRAKELVDEGAIGDVTVMRSTFCMAGNPADRQPDANWRWNRAKGGGSIYDLACNNIHRARWIVDADPVRVFSSGTFGPEVDDATFTQLLFPDDSVAQISVGWTSWDAHYADICGTDGMIHIDRVWNNENSPTALEVRRRSGVERIEFEPVFQFENQLQHLCDCLTTGAPHRISPENSIGQMRTIDAAFESIRTGEAIALGPAE